MKHKIISIYAFVVALLFFANAGRGDTLTVVTSQAGQNADDSVSWAQLGGDGTILTSSFAVGSASGISVSVGLTGPNSIVSVVCSQNPSSSCSWTGLNATANDTLLWTSDAANGGNGPLTLIFSTAISGAGAVIQADAPGQFTAQIQAFNGTNSLGSFTLTSDSNGDPLYIGVTDQSGANITSVGFNLTACTDLLGVCNDFALDTVSLSTASVSINPNSLTFTGQALNTTSSPQSVTLNNFTASAVTITNIAASGDFAAPNNTCGTSVAANGSCTISVTFTPTSAGTRTGTLTITDSGGNSPQTVSLTGSGPAAAATLSPSPLTFSGQLVGSTSSAQSVTVQNTGTATLTVLGVSISGANSSDFNISNNGCTSVNVGNSCTISITFEPAATGTRTATLSVTDNAGNSPQSINLSGTGTSPVAGVAPNSLTFSGQRINTTSAPQIVTLGNTGTGPLTITNIAMTGDFAQTNNCNGSVAAGGSCAISVSFTPKQTGTRTGTLTITDNSNGSPQSVSLSGTGTDPIASLSPNSLPAFPSTPVGSTSAGQNVTLTNTGNAPLSIGNIVASGDFAENDNCPAALPSTSGSNSCTITVTFTPTASGARTGTLTLTDSATNSPQTMSLSGTGVTGPAAKLTPATGLSFSGQLVGSTSSAQAVTVTNTGGTTLTLSGYSITGTNSSDFAIASGGTCTSTSSLAPNGTCTINVTFTPASAASFSANLSVADNATGSPQTLGLTGTGTQPGISFSPSSVPFGSQTVGTTSSAHAVTVTNSGTATLTLSSISITGTNPTDFSIASGGTCTSTSSLAPNGTCTINVTFTPASAASFSANLTVADNAPSSPQSVVGLTGTGTQPGISFTPGSLPFGNQLVGSTSSALSTTVKNTGTATMTISSVSITGTNASDFAISSNTCGTSLAVSATCSVSVTFKPAAVGSRTANISVADSAPGSPQSVPLTGTGIQPAISLTPSTGLAFGSQAAGTTSSAQSVTVTNSGTATLTLSSISITGTNPSDFAIASGGTCTSTSSLAPNGTCTINVTFTPASATSFSASLTVAGNAPNSPQSVNLTGTGTSTGSGPAASLSPTSLTFGSQQVGTTSALQSVTLKNTGTAALTITTIKTSGDFAEGTGCGTSLAAGSSCLINVVFKPTATGTRTGTLSVTDNATSSPQTVSLTGTGTSTVSLSPTSLTFASQTVGTTSSAQSVTLKNNGTAALSITSIAASGDFAQTNTCGTSVAASGSCSISVTFKPTTTGTRTGAITITDNATGSPQTVSLSGTGTNPNTPGTSFNPTSITFSTPQTVGTTSAAQSTTLTNNGTATLSITSVSITGTNASDFSISANTCGTSLAVNASCSISVTFKPSATGTRSASISVADNAPGTPQTVSLTGTGTSTTSSPAVSLNPTSLTFGSQQVGTTSALQSVTLKNTGTAALTITTIKTSGDFAEGDGCGTSLAAGSSCLINVVFKPTATGTRTGTLSVTDNATGSPQTVSLTGTGTSTVSLSPTSLTFASQTVGTTSSAQSVTLKNNGTAALSITSIAASGDFAQTNTCGTSVAASGSCSISVTFKPTTTGTRTGAITITDNAAGSPQTISLSGGATPANGTYTITNSAGTLVWDDPGFVKTAGTLIDLYASNGGTNQKWVLASLGNGYYTITNSNSSLVLDDPGSSTVSGTKLDQNTANGGTNQHWLLTVSGSGYTIKCQVSGMMVDASTNTQGTDIVQATASGASTQVWTIH